MQFHGTEGNTPISDFLDSLDRKTSIKITSRITMLSEHWKELKRPYVDYLGDGIYELRVVLFGNQARIIYAYVINDYIVFLHGFMKHSDAVPLKDINIASSRLHDFKERIKNGKIKLL